MKVIDSHILQFKSNIPFGSSEPYLYIWTLKHYILKICSHIFLKIAVPAFKRKFHFYVYFGTGGNLVFNFGCIV